MTLPIHVPPSNQTTMIQTLAQIKEQIELAGAKLSEPVDGWYAVVPPVKMNCDPWNVSALVVGVIADIMFPIKVLTENGTTDGCTRCRAIPAKKKRLMTPAEIADGWLCIGRHRKRVSEWNVQEVWLAGQDDGQTVASLHAVECKFARTATSEPVSLEVEDDKVRPSKAETP